MFGAAYSQQLWSYPPHYALLMIPFGAMAYMVALAVFMAMNLAAFGLTSWQLVGAGWKQLAVAVLVSPAAICGFLSGQLALAFTALQCWIFLLLDRRPILAGALLGLLSIKPQLGIAYPFFLLAMRRWKVLVSATLMTLLLVALSSAILGVDMWSAYLWQGVPAQHHYMMEHTPLWTQKLMPTWFMDMKNAGFSYDVALAGQWVLAALAASLFFTRRFRALESVSQMLVVSAAGILMTPYLMPYDTLFFACGLLYAAQRRRIDVWFGLLMVAGYVFPALFWGASTLGIVGTSLLPLLVILHAMWGKKLALRSA
jgi:hypothetical protein